MEKAIFTISLDFELHWGRLDKVQLQKMQYYYRNARVIIPRLLQLFEKYEIEVSWATVGMLFAENWEEWKAYLPDNKPYYRNPDLSPYHWVSQQGKTDGRSLFAPELIESIIQTPKQEVASHTFSHYYTMEPWQTFSQFREDLRAARKIAYDKFGLNLESLVFPRNQYNDDYQAICFEEGFHAIRSNPKDWFWKHTEDEKLIKKIFRTGDTVIPMGGKTHYSMETLDRRVGYPINIPASRLLRPYKKNSLFNRRRVDRIKSELSEAASQKKVYHLWWHPHNFGNYPEQNLLLLEEILQHFDTLREKFQMESKNMKSITEMFSKSPLKVI
ncbi:polysaccharide deacetylase family protein [Echinicola jeungdonensis]|uniref:Polysaccharide deacetylase family protein n=1 Tax=Echinicola jeungdonensis TaxID=709343 RepID=A0ABV5J0S0_9BACT|nr:polysaccharide deacetylase family protein [Echinicola jeungdonensis]MDN3667856.1 polysaccharide deacetylase family protein [Echinicola jeungdonensis]